MKNILLITLLTILSLSATETTLSEELLEKYFQKEVLIMKNGMALNKITINGPATPPFGFTRKIAKNVTITASEVSSTLTLPVPTFNWSFGCSATTAAMIAGYYDRTGYSNIYTGPTNNGIMPLNNSSWPNWTDNNGDTLHQCPLSATHDGLDGRTTRGHVDDYWVGENDTGMDPFKANDWTEHTYGSCTGDYMKTNQAQNYYDSNSYGNPDGGTTFYFWVDSGDPMTMADMEGYGIHNQDGGYGFKLFFESCGYTVTEMYNQNIDSIATGGFSFAQYKAEIDAGHPVLIHITGHTMAGVGYDITNNTVLLHDTWDYNIHSMTWGGSYSGMTHQNVTVIHLTGAEAIKSTTLAPIYYLLGM